MSLKNFKHILNPGGIEVQSLSEVEEATSDTVSRIIRMLIDEKQAAPPRYAGEFK